VGLGIVRERHHHFSDRRLESPLLIPEALSIPKAIRVGRACAGYCEERVLKGPATGKGAPSMVLDGPASGEKGSKGGYLGVGVGVVRGREPLKVPVLRKERGQMLGMQKLPNLAGYRSYRSTSPIRKRPPPQDPPSTLGIGLRKGPRGVCLLLSEVLLYMNHS